VKDWFVGAGVYISKKYNQVSNWLNEKDTRLTLFSYLDKMTDTLSKMLEQLQRLTKKSLFSTIFDWIFSSKDSNTNIDPVVRRLDTIIQIMRKDKNIGFWNNLTKIFTKSYWNEMKRFSIRKTKKFFKKIDKKFIKPMRLPLQWKRVRRKTKKAFEWVKNFFTPNTDEKVLVKILNRMDRPFLVKVHDDRSRYEPSIWTRLDVLFRSAKYAFDELSTTTKSLGVGSALLAGGAGLAAFMSGGMLPLALAGGSALMGGGAFLSDKFSNNNRHSSRKYRDPRDEILTIMKKGVPVFLVKGTQGWLGKFANTMWKGFSKIGLGGLFTKIFGYAGRSFNDFLYDKINEVVGLLEDINKNTKKSFLGNALKIGGLLALVPILSTFLPSLTTMLPAMSGMMGMLPQIGDILSSFDPMMMLGGVEAIGGLLGLGKYLTCISKKKSSILKYFIKTYIFHFLVLYFLF
jgi:hypothetical protein